MGVRVESVQILKFFQRRINGPSLTIWDRNGKFKEKLPLNLPTERNGIKLGLLRMPGKRFALVQTNSFGQGSQIDYFEKKN